MSVSIHASREVSTHERGEKLFPYLWDGVDVVETLGRRRSRAADILYLHCLLVITDKDAVCRVPAAFNSSLHALYAGGYLKATLVIREKETSQPYQVRCQVVMCEP